jgi:hypothetical protein
MMTKEGVAKKVTGTEVIDKIWLCRTNPNKEHPMLQQPEILLNRFCDL